MKAYLAGLFLFLSTLGFSQLEEQLNESLKSILNQKRDYEFLEAHEDNGKYLGQGELFGKHIHYTAELGAGDRLKTIEIIFPPSFNLKKKDLKKLGGKDVEDILPPHWEAPAQSIHFDFHANGISVSGAWIKFEQKEWKPILKSPFLIHNPLLRIDINNPGKRAILSGELSGNVKIKDQTLPIIGQREHLDIPWDLKTNLQTRRLTALIELLGVKNLDDLHAPDAIYFSELQEIELEVFPKAEHFKITALNKFGEFEGLIWSTTAKTLSYEIGFKLPPQFTMEEIHPTMKPVTGMGFHKSIILISSDTMNSKLELSKMVNDSLGLLPGASFFSIYDFARVSPEFTRFFGQEEVIFQTPLSNRKQDCILSSTYLDKLDFAKNGIAVLDHMKLFFIPETRAISLDGHFNLKCHEDILTYQAHADVKISDFTFNLSGKQIGEWKNPYGVAQAVTITNLGINFDLNFRTTPITLPIWTSNGKLVANSILTNSVTLIVDPKNASKSMIDGVIETLSIEKLTKSFCSQDVVSNIPSNISKTISSIALKNARLTLAPKGKPIDFRNIHANPSLFIHGKAKVLGEEMELEITPDYYKGVQASGSLQEINHDSAYLLNGGDGFKRPRFELQLNSGPNSGFKIFGESTLLGVISKQPITVKDNFFSLDCSGPLFAKYDSEFITTGNNIKNKESFVVDGSLSAIGRDSIASSLCNVLLQSTQERTLIIEHAKGDWVKCNHSLDSLELLPDSPEKEKQKSDLKKTRDSIQQVLTGADGTPKGLHSGAEWFTKTNPGPVFTLTDCDFEGVLHKLHQGKITLNIKGKYAGSDYKESLEFDFKNPEASITAWKDHFTL